MALFGPIPLPKMIPDREPGGAVASAYNKLSNEALNQEMQRLKNQYYAPNIESEIAQRQALTQGQNITNKFLPQTLQSQIAKEEFRRKNPLLFLPGAAGQVGAQMYLRQNKNSFNQPNALQGQQQIAPVSQQMPSAISPASPEDYAQQIANTMQVGNQAKLSRSELDKTRTQGYNFSQLPVDYKSAVLAQAAGLGYSPEEASRRLLGGETLEKLASEKGFQDSTQYPEPIYALTGPGRTQLQRRQQALSELNAVSKDIVDALKPYSRRLKGFSPKQVVEALRGKNKDSQAKYLAARALQPELAAIRLRMANGNVGIEAIREMVHSSMGNINVYEPLIGGEVYEKANDYVDKWLNKMSDAANKQATKIVNTGNKKPSLKPTLRYNQQTGDFEEIS